MTIDHDNTTIQNVRHDKTTKQQQLQSQNVEHGTTRQCNVFVSSSSLSTSSLSYHQSSSVQPTQDDPSMMQKEKDVEEDTKHHHHHHPSSSSSSSSTTTIHYPIEIQWMMTLETALQLYFSQTKRSYITYAEFASLIPRLTLNAPTAKETTLSSSLSSSSSSSASISIPWTEIEPRLWHDWYCLAVPNLYQVVIVVSESNQSILSHTNLSPSSLRMEVVTKQQQQPQQQLPQQQQHGSNGSNRWNEWRQLIHHATRHGISKEKSQQASYYLKLLLKHRTTSKEEDNSTLSFSTSSSSTSTSFSKTTWQQQQQQQQQHRSKGQEGHKQQQGKVNPALSLERTCPTNTTGRTLTVEERVRARGKQRQHLLETVHEAKLNPKEDRLAVADALFSHARHILRRRNSQIRSMVSNGPNTNNNTNNYNNNQEGTKASTKCVLTFSDLLPVVPSPYQNRHKLTWILQDIVQRTPSWITWMDPNLPGKNPIPLSKFATVWIDTLDYKVIRARLAGEEFHPPQTPPPRSLPVTAPMSTMTSSSSSSTGMGPSSRIMTTSTITTTTTTSGPRPVTVSGTKRTNDHHGNTMENTTTMKRIKLEDQNLSPPPPSPPPRASYSLKCLTETVARTDATVAQSQGQPTQRLPSSESIQDKEETKEAPSNAVPTINPKKRVVEATTKTNVATAEQDKSHDVLGQGPTDSSFLLSPSSSPSPITLSPHKKQRRTSLRINPNLILCDADYDGGGIIQPSFELPRGLRRMFRQMNAGQRI